jgi:hypothetical protein
VNSVLTQDAHASLEVRIEATRYSSWFSPDESATAQTLQCRFGFLDGWP